MPGPSPAPAEVDVPDVDDVVEPDIPWIVLVWNDPINLMSYVTYVFQKLFGYSLEKAESLMLDVHHKGRAVVSSGTRERAERGDVDPRVAGRGRVLIGAIAAQGGLGYLQYFADVPEGLVGLHVLGSVLVWVAVLRFHLALHEGVPEPEPERLVVAG